MDAALVAQVKKFLRTVKPFSDSVQIALRQLNQQPVDMNAVANTLQLDPVLTGSILRLANSPFYGFARKITQIHDAVVLLGLHTLRQVVIAFSVVDTFQGKEGVKERKALWRHSVAVAAASKRLAEACGENSDDAFIAGIMHDIGRFILAQSLPADYPKALAYRESKGCGLLEAEKAVLGMHHGQVGAVAIKHWKLPEALADVAQHHMYPLTEQQPTPLNDLVHLANVLVMGLWIGCEETPCMEPLSPEVLSRLKLSWSDIEELLPEIEAMSHELIERMLP